MSDQKTVYLYPNLKKEHAKETTREVINILKGLDFRVLLPHEADGFGSADTSYVTYEEGAELCEYMISIGGDGTILKCAELAAKNKKPLLGINCGRLGFMASLERDKLSELSKLKENSFSIDERMMLDISIERANGEKTVMNALNEAVLSCGADRFIQDFTVSADGLTVSSLRADGLIFSTPTGASAYSLSAGGPLIEPGLDCIEFTQICPHSLFARSMIFSPEKVITVRFKSAAGGEAALSADGRKPLKVSEGDGVIIRRSELRLKLIDIYGGSYFRAVNTKLMQPTKHPGAEKEE